MLEQYNIDFGLIKRVSIEGHYYTGIFSGFPSAMYQLTYKNFDKQAMIWGVGVRIPVR
jgi:hypothetical protein